jgi:probable HAF family extracellular repeat protein
MRRTLSALTEPVCPPSGESALHPSFGQVRIATKSAPWQAGRMGQGRLRVRARRAALAVAVTLTFATADAHAETWTVGAIEGPPGTTRIQPKAVNSSGVVVGVARFAGDTRDSAFRWEDGVMIKLDTAGFEQTVATDINDDGVIVGYGAMPSAEAGNAESSENGLVWTATQTTSSATPTAHNLYGPFGAADQDYGSSVRGINNDGKMTGRAGVRWQDLLGPIYGHAPALTTGGAWTEIPLPHTETTKYGGTGLAINDKGQIMGTGGPGADRPWISDNGGPPGTQLELVAGERGFNNHGHIAGRTFGGGASFTARLWDGAEYVEIGAGQPKSMANAVNDDDWAVGRAGADLGQSVLTGGNAWLWRPGQAPTPLYELAPDGWQMVNATDINNAGMIVGTGYFGGEQVGFWMAPAYKVTGTVYGAGVLPAAGVRVKGVSAAGSLVDSATTNAQGRYELTLPQGNGYAISAEPPGAYLPDLAAGCNAVERHVCRLNLAQNRTIDFYSPIREVPRVPVPVTGPPVPTTGNASTGSPPVIKLARKATKLTASAKGVVTLALAPFASDTKVSVVLKTRAKKAVKLGSASARAKAGKKVQIKLKLSAKGKRELRKRSLKAVATVTATDAAGRRTVKPLRVTIAAPKKQTKRK